MIRYSKMFNAEPITQVHYIARLIATENDCVPVYKHTYTHNNYTFSIYIFTHTLGTYLINVNINVACWQPYIESRAARAGSSSSLGAKLTDGRLVHTLF